MNRRSRALARRERETSRRTTTSKTHPESQNIAISSTNMEQKYLPPPLSHKFRDCYPAIYCLKENNDE